MKTLDESRRLLRSCVVVLVALLVSAAASARAGRGDAWARDKYAAAQHMREVLNGRPAAERTRHDYQRVVDSFRRVYFGAPSSTKADPSAFAVADLLLEMGRRFDDEKTLRSALEQYRFLRREYPGSKYRADALFTIGEICKGDLDQPREARNAYEEFLRRYPNHPLAADARHALSELSEKVAGTENEHKETGGRDLARRQDNSRSDKLKRDQDHDEEGVASEAKRPKAGRVTAVRHWSTPDYTRVAIDLEQKVQFDSQRIDHPDRIFFDLRDTQLAAALVGKSFRVEDGLLKKLRVAQFQPGRARVVLELEGPTDYNAFLLTRPYRLIIDVRGKVRKTAAKRETPIDTWGNAHAESDVKPELNNVHLETQELAQVTGSQAMANLDAPSSGTRNQTSLAEERGANKVAQSSATTPQTPPTRTVVEPDDDDADLKVTPLQTADLPREIPRTERVAAPAPPSGGRAPSKHKGSDRNLENRDTSDLVKSTQGSRRKGEGKSASVAADIDVREAKPTSKGDRSLIRALGLKIGKIVIDPGHGGHDTGTIGPNGLEEKDLVLGVARRLGNLLETRLGADVIYTRQDDTFIPLETRTAIANQERADLFVSIHANSSRDRDARGVETYYLNFTSNPSALEVAARENAVSDKSIHELQDLVKKIALKEKIEESREFACDVQHALHTGLATKSPAIRDRGVKKAPFIVLIGANMPSILAEISFISNPTDAHKLETAEYRQRIAESLYHGISTYISGLSGVKVASRLANSSTR